MNVNLGQMKSGIKLFGVMNQDIVFILMDHEGFGDHRVRDLIQKIL
jgi:hypothetical protein